MKSQKNQTGLMIHRASVYKSASFLFTLAIVTSLLLGAKSSPDAQAVTPPDSCFNFESGTGTIIGYYDNEGNDSANPACTKAIDIPSSIGGVAVASIGSSAFSQKQLISVTIPNSVTNIANFAFILNQITSITIPSSVTYIDYWAFAHNQISDPIILGTPTGGSDIFLHNPIESISYNGTVHNVNSTATTPTDICFSFDPITNTIYDYKLFSLSMFKDGTACMDLNIIIPAQFAGVPVTEISNGMSPNKQLIGVVIPNGVVSIGSNAFGNARIASVSIPESVTYIGASAFSSNLLTTITIPNSVITIGDYAFADNQLTDVTIPTSVTSLGEFVFQNNPLNPCFGFDWGSGTITNYYDYEQSNSANPACPRTVDIPETFGGTPVTTIGSAAFAWKQITSVTIPSGVTSIGDYAFYNNLLSSISIPNGVTTIDVHAFDSNQLSNVIIPNSLTNIGDYAFSFNELSSLSIPSSVSTIGSYTFAGNLLENVSIPEGMTSIDYCTFCSNLLTEITIPSTITSIGEYAFSKNQITTLTIPNNVAEVGTDAFADNQLTSPVIIGNPTGPNVFKNNPLESISYNGTINPVPPGPASPVMPPDVCFDFDAATGRINAYELFRLSALNVGVFCSGSNIIVPSTIGGTPVIGASSYTAFNGKGLTGLSLPDSITNEIDVGFNYLSSLKLPSGLTEMTDYAYAYNSLSRLTIPNSVSVLQPDALFGQNQWGVNIQNQDMPDKYIFSDDPTVVQQVYNSIWYTRAYTADPSNPNNLRDFAVSEWWELGDGNQNSTDTDPIGGHIINPASTIVRYQNSYGNPLSSDVTVTGLKTGRAESGNLESDAYLHTYLVNESAILAPLDPYSPSTEEMAAMETGFSQYYRMGEDITFQPKTFAGYQTPSAQTVTLNQEDNVVTFTYNSLVTSVPFTDSVVVDGALSEATPPAGVHFPLITSSRLSITDANGNPSDCNRIQSANLLAPSILNGAVPVGITLLGGVEFSLNCSNGGTTGIDFAMGFVISDISKLRIYKYVTPTQQMNDITSQVTISTKMVEGKNRTVIGYVISDGGSLDEDGTANGTIEDPLVIGYEGILPSDTGDDTLAETGVSFWMSVTLSALSIIASGGIFLKRSKMKTRDNRATSKT